MFLYLSSITEEWNLMPVPFLTRKKTFESIGNFRLNKDIDAYFKKVWETSHLYFVSSKLRNW